MSPAKCRYKFNKGENLVPAVVTEPPIPVEFFILCNCSKCSRPGVSPCRLIQIVCCCYQKC